MHDIVGSEVIQKEIWSMCILAQAARSVEGFIESIVDSKLHQIDVEHYWSSKFICHFFFILFPIVTFCGLDSTVRIISVLCSTGESETTTALEFCPRIGLF